MSDINAVVFSTTRSVDDSFGAASTKVAQLDGDVFVLVSDSITR